MCCNLVWILVVLGLSDSLSLMQLFQPFMNKKSLYPRVQSQVESYQRLKKMVLDISLLNTQHYKVWIKGQVEQSREWSSTLPYTLV